MVNPTDGYLSKLRLQVRDIALDAPEPKTRNSRICSSQIITHYTARFSSSSERTSTHRPCRTFYILRQLDNIYGVLRERRVTDGNVNANAIAV